MTCRSHRSLGLTVNSTINNSVDLTLSFPSIYFVLSFSFSKWLLCLRVSLCAFDVIQVWMSRRDYLSRSAYSEYYEIPVHLYATMYANSSSRDILTICQNKASLDRLLFACLMNSNSFMQPKYILPDQIRLTAPTELGENFNGTLTALATLIIVMCIPS